MEEQGSGTPKGSHVVEFLFDVQESIYKSEWTVDNSIISKFGTVVSFLLSIIAFLKIAKLVLEKIIDTTLIKRAKKNKRRTTKKREKKEKGKKEEKERKERKNSSLQKLDLCFGPPQRPVPDNKNI